MSLATQIVAMTNTFHLRPILAQAIQGEGSYDCFSEGTAHFLLPLYIWLVSFFSDALRNIMKVTRVTSLESIHLSCKLVRYEEISALRSCLQSNIGVITILSLLVCSISFPSKWIFLKWLLWTNCLSKPQIMHIQRKLKHSGFIEYKINFL